MYKIVFSTTRGRVETRYSEDVDWLILQLPSSIKSYNLYRETEDGFWAWICGWKKKK